MVTSANIQVFKLVSSKMNSKNCNKEDSVKFTRKTRNKCVDVQYAVYRDYLLHEIARNWTTEVIHISCGPSKVSTYGRPNVSYTQLSLKTDDF